MGEEKLVRSPAALWQELAVGAQYCPEKAKLVYTTPTRFLSQSKIFLPHHGRA